jgi:hypothetical protein
LKEVLWMNDPCLDKGCSAVWEVISDGDTPWVRL